MRSEAEKGELELIVFRKFAERSGLAVVAGSIVKRCPPEPDILCTLASGESIAFELAEACAPEFAAAASEATRKGVAVAFGADVSVETLRKKLLKSYTSSHPIELLLYTNGLTALLDEHIAQDIAKLLCGRAQPFRRIWLMGDGVQILAGDA